MSDSQMLALLAAPSVISLLLLWYVSYKFMRLFDQLERIEEWLVDFAKAENFEELGFRAQAHGSKLDAIYDRVKGKTHLPTPAD